ncbi:FAD-dependent oxidoreductase [Nocardia blacklockiae]|uniref:FAD-dependent oxidoreductase n=1 Tax=Nocardia blacklockiae TaxID=480036 RepID=UPI001895D9C0|nr:NAD(P)/FAD-dependent oxidoreductase [Nocardia blacklockiae]MBF6174990.1 FAD-dependent monooxygenase [Nocardia blacklockiae]
MNSPAPRIAVVGAGIGGLACAGGLRIHGFAVTVFERDTAPRARRQGGMLDLHVPTGQAALRTLGLFERFLASARPEAQEMRAVDPVTAELLHHELPGVGERSAPEIDRGRLRELLLDSLEPGTVQWGRPVERVTPRVDATPRLHFADGTTEDFDLVVGADGAWSRIRPAVSAVTPAYLGNSVIECSVTDLDRHPALATLVGSGTLMATAGATMLSAQRADDGRLSVYAGLADVPVDWHVDAGVDLDDPAAVREHLLGSFDGWHDSLRDLIRHSTDFVNRPLYVLPVGHSWDHVPGVTLLGDAAHLMPPYGVGANLALLDGTDLAAALATHPDLDRAVRAYEHTAIPRATAAAKACTDITADLASGGAHHVDASRAHLNEQLLHAGERASAATGG